MTDNNDQPCTEEHACGCHMEFETTTDRAIDAVKAVLEFGLLCVSVIVIFLGLGGDLPWQN